MIKNIMLEVAKIVIKNCKQEYEKYKKYLSWLLYCFYTCTIFTLLCLENSNKYILQWLIYL